MPARQRDRDQRVLVVGCRDYDGVDVVPREQVLIILVQVDLAFLPVLGVIFLHALLEAGSFDVVDVASCQHADAVDRKEARQQVHRLLTETDEADADRIVGRAFLFRGFRSGSQSRRHQYGSCGLPAPRLSESRGGSVWISHSYRSDWYNGFIRTS